MQNKTPSTSHDMLGTQFWRRPTLARPIAVLPSGLQRFTAVFGMGTGGATALLSPEVRAGLALNRTDSFAASQRDASRCRPLGTRAIEGNRLYLNFERTINNQLSTIS